MTYAPRGRATDPEPDASRLLLAATRACLRANGFAGLTTRKVAEGAGMPLSQIHYHFGSKKGLVLALLAQQNAARLERQERMYARDEPLWRRWLRACDYLDEDLDSGYVRVLQEMIAAGWHDVEIAAEARALLRGWYTLLARVAREAAAALGGLGPFTAEEAAALAGNAFMGAESMILLGFDGDAIPSRSALRKIGSLMRLAEMRRKRGGHHAREESGP